MIRFFALLLFVLPVAAQDAPIVRVQRESDKPYVTHCGSGTLVSRDKTHSFILTCRHVVPDGQRGVSIFTSGRQYAAEFVRADDAADLALIKVLGHFDHALVSDVDPPQDAVMHQWGCPGGGPCCYKSGRLLPWDGTQFTRVAPVWSLHLTPQGGDSGAGVFYDGLLVGVVFAGHDGPFVGGKPTIVGPELIVGLPGVRRFLNNAKGK
jgi:hypothetical protein